MFRLAQKVCLVVAVLALTGIAASGASFLKSGQGTADDGMVLIPAGEAVLGGEKFAQMPGPARRYLPDYWIDRYEVTNADYHEFTTATAHQAPLFADDPAFNQSDQPVTGVTRFDAEAFCLWAGKRLPTEREWEKAARGVDGRLYPWGNEEDPSRAHLDAAAPIAVSDQVRDVSPYGVIGMAGNVSEWVEEMFVGGPSCQNPDAAIKINARPITAGGETLKFKAYIRGNNIQGLPHMTRLAHHLWDYPDTMAEFVGFRCARDSFEEKSALYQARHGNGKRL